MSRADSLSISFRSRLIRIREGARQYGQFSGSMEADGATAEQMQNGGHSGINCVEKNSRNLSTNSQVPSPKVLVRAGLTPIPKN